GRFVAARAADGMVLALAGGGWQWRWPNARRLDFDGQGRLVAIAAANGDRLRLRWRAGRFGEVVDRGGRGMVRRWRGGRLLAGEAPGFARLALGFDDEGRLVSARTPGGLERYWYEDPRAAHRLTGAGPRRAGAKSVRLRRRGPGRPLAGGGRAGIGRAAPG